MNITKILIVVLFGLLTSCTYPPSTNKESEIKWYYNLSHPEQLKYYNGLQLEEKFSLYVKSTRQKHHYDYKLADSVAELGKQVLPYFTVEFQKKEKYNSYEIWRYIDVLNQINKEYRINCSDMVIINAVAASNRLDIKTVGYIAFIEAGIDKLQKNCKK